MIELHIIELIITSVLSTYKRIDAGDIIVLKVVELFAGVGGFRLGLERCSKQFETIWTNQWEPGKKTQHAFECYEKHFGKSSINTNEDISVVKNQCPEHDLLVGGFPCQDYSVARTQAKGLEGKKGVLWWEIRDIVKNKKPSYILLENVDRILKSPGSQRGRDFGVILRSLYELGYAVEWRVINAAEYGFAQRRRRTFIFASKENTKHYKTLIASSASDVLLRTGLFSSEFIVEQEEQKIFEYNVVSSENGAYDDLADFSNRFEAGFQNAGYMVNGNTFTTKVTPIECVSVPLKEIIEKNTVDPKYFLNGSLEKWEYLKGPKKILRKRPNGENYTYSEGGMSFPDNINLPSRTMLTSESSVNRSSHVVIDYKTNKLRLLTPIECERLNGFPDEWTNTGMPEKFRYFVMGNALVVPVITRIGKAILKIV